MIKIRTMRHTKDTSINDRTKKTTRERMSLAEMEEDSEANNIYLAGPEHDIRKIAFVNPTLDKCLKFELKIFDQGIISNSPPFKASELVRIVSPKEAKSLLKKCSYKYSSGEKIPKPHPETLKKVLKLLSYKS